MAKSDYDTENDSAEDEFQVVNAKAKIPWKKVHSSVSAQTALHGHVFKYKVGNTDSTVYM